MFVVLVLLAVDIALTGDFVAVAIGEPIDQDICASSGRCVPVLLFSTYTKMPRWNEMIDRECVDGMGSCRRPRNKNPKEHASREWRTDHIRNSLPTASLDLPLQLSTMSLFVARDPCSSTTHTQ
jgi:hypothetical protein